MKSVSFIVPDSPGPKRPSKFSSLILLSVCFPTSCAPGTARQRSSTLSGGQQQRAAIARTLVQEAKVILADEPIASLDPASSQAVMEILAQINAEDGVTVIASLHQVEYARRYCPRTVALRDGRVAFDGPSERLTPDFLRGLYGAGCEDILGPSDDGDQPDSLAARPGVHQRPDRLPAHATA